MEYPCEKGSEIFDGLVECDGDAVAFFRPRPRGKSKYKPNELIPTARCEIHSKFMNREFWRSITEDEYNLLRVMKD